MGEGRRTRRFSCVLLALFLLCSLPGPVFATEAKKIIINKKVNKLAYLENGQVSKIFPVATGRTPDLTPEGSFRVVRKVVNPYYNKLKIPGGSPRNPLGARWLGIDARGTSGGTYGIHGTNNPKSIGKYASGGCIRMFNQDVIWLYERTPIGTPVEIINRDWDLEGDGLQKFVELVVNGKTVAQDGEGRAYLEDNRVTVPIRTLAEALDAVVTWDAGKKEVTVQQGETQICFVVNSREITVNGIPKIIDKPVIMKHGRAFVHVRVLAEAFGYGVAWDENNCTVVLTKP